MSRIFISYRRGDSAGHTGRLLDSLESRFGSENLFRDIENLEAGVDFPDALDRALSNCKVVLVMIGREWASAAGPKGRRLDQPGDFVRMEVATALSREDVRVIPVLVDGGGVPEAEDLPEDLRSLVRRNAIELSDTRWDYDVGRLSETLGKLLGLSDEGAPEAPATPADAGVGATSGGGHGLRNLVLAAGAVLALAVIGLLWSSNGDPGEPTTRPGGQTAGSSGQTGMASSYDSLVASCEQQAAWVWGCEVPAIPTIHPFADGACACVGRILLHIETGLFRCEELPQQCGGVSFEETLGYPPDMDWYEDVTPL